MKNLITLLGIYLLLSACQPSATTEYGTADTTSAIIIDKHYGDTIDESSLTEVSILHHVLTSSDSAQVKLKGKIVQTCKVKGCWMNVAMADGDTMRVTFKDYGFFVPRSGMEGKEVVFQGIAKKSEVSIKDLQHYAKDEGATDEEIQNITKPRHDVSFEASGVLIRNLK